MTDLECPLCDRTVEAHPSGRPKMHLIPADRRPGGEHVREWCEGGNPLQDGSLVTPICRS
jgi:hypothetical protein